MSNPCLLLPTPFNADALCSHGCVVAAKGRVKRVRGAVWGRVLDLYGLSRAEAEAAAMRFRVPPGGEWTALCCKTCAAAAETERVGASEAQNARSRHVTGAYAALKAVAAIIFQKNFNRRAKIRAFSEEEEMLELENTLNNLGCTATLLLDAH